MKTIAFSIAALFIISSCNQEKRKVALGENDQVVKDSIEFWVNLKYLNCLDSGKSVCDCQKQNNFLLIHLDTTLNELRIKPSVYYSWEPIFLVTKQDSNRSSRWKTLPTPELDTMIWDFSENSLVGKFSNQAIVFKKIRANSLDKWVDSDLSSQLGVINTKPLLKYSISPCNETISFPLSNEILSNFITTGQINVSCSDDYHYNELYIKPLKVEFFLVYKKGSIKVYKETVIRDRMKKIDTSQLKDCQLFYKVN
jgi:hypothetical protein